MKNLDQPALPLRGHSGLIRSQMETGEFTGLSKLEHVCISLRLPETGDVELDDLIRKAQRRDVAAQVLQGLLANTNHSRNPVHSMDAAQHADMLLSELSKAGK